MSAIGSVVFFLNMPQREENLPQVSEKPPAVVVSFRVIWDGATEIMSCCSWMAVLADIASTFVPLVGGLVDKSQVGMEHGVTRQEEENEHQEAQHEDDSGKSQK